MPLKTIDGLPIFDAKHSLKLEISPNDIAKADPKQPADCAVARSIRRTTHCKEVRVHLGRIYVRSNASNWQRYLTPKPMRNEIIAFDRGGTFEPAKFTLLAPQPSKRLGKRQGGGLQTDEARQAPIIPALCRERPLGSGLGLCE